MGCPTTGCVGYELERDLDFDDSGFVTSIGWTRIGSRIEPYNAKFNGNGKVLKNMMINRSGTLANTDGTGLFGGIGVNGEVYNLGLEDVDITDTQPSQIIGAIAGYSAGLIYNCYATGTITTDNGGNRRVGGLVGRLLGNIRTSYTTVDITGGFKSGGIVGRIATHLTAGSISGFTSCYSLGSVTVVGGANRGGGAVGESVVGVLMKTSFIAGSVTSPAGSGKVAGWIPDLNTRETHITAGTADIHKNYFDQDVVGSNRSTNFSSDSNQEPLATHIQNKRTTALQTPTDYTGIYATWDDFDIDGSGSVTDADKIWDFGTSTQYPALKIDFNGDGTATVEEFGSQR
jgi:hypothetical protein